MGKFLRKNWFIIGIAVALVFAGSLPRVGARLNSGSYFSTVLVILLFLISGARLPTESIKSGLKSLPLHLYIQLFIFAFFPLLIFVTSLPFRGHGQISIGLYALACLPTTISSCIIFTQTAGGNVVAAIFNAALANVAGVFLSPLLLSLFLRSSGSALPFSELLRILRNLGFEMLLPIIVGQIARRFVKQWVDTSRKRLGVVSNVFILLILFLAFSRAAVEPSFFSNVKKLPLLFAYLAVVHLVMVSVAYGGARMFRFPREDSVTVLFAAPQKTLAMGVPLLTTFFAAQPNIIGVALLPLLFYHPWQLLVAGLLQRVVGKRMEALRQSESHRDSGTDGACAVEAQGSKESTL